MKSKIKYLIIPPAISIILLALVTIAFSTASAWLMLTTPLFMVSCVFWAFCWIEKLKVHQSVFNWLDSD